MSRTHLSEEQSICTCALFWWPPFALSIHVAAEGPGKMLIHHAADVTLVIGEEDTAGGQVLCLGGLLFLLGALLWPHGRVGRRGSAGGRRGGSWSSGARDPRHPLRAPGIVHKIPAVRSGHTCGSLTAGNRVSGRYFAKLTYRLRYAAHMMLRYCRGWNNKATHPIYIAKRFQFTNKLNAFLHKCKKIKIKHHRACLILCTNYQASANKVR